MRYRLSYIGNTVLLVAFVGVVVYYNQRLDEATRRVEDLQANLALEHGAARQIETTMRAWVEEMKEDARPAADLTRIDSRIVKEPAYQSKEPRYCLLALGRGAEKRVWLAQDATTLFVDRNGNGDLTDPGERVEAEGANENGVWFRTFLPDADGKTKHQLDVSLMKSSLTGEEKEDPFTYSLSLSWTRHRTFGAWGDETGPLIFARGPIHAPVIYIDGPLQMGFECHRPLIKRGRDTYELSAGVGTRGIGKGSFAHLKYERNGVPGGVQPTAVLEFPSKTPGGPPLRVETVLTQRC